VGGAFCDTQGALLILVGKCCSTKVLHNQKRLENTGLKTLSTTGGRVWRSCLMPGTGKNRDPI
jgi:hypothetical protein